MVDQSTLPLFPEPAHEVEENEFEQAEPTIISDQGIADEQLVPSPATEPDGDHQQAVDATLPEDVAEHPFMAPPPRCTMYDVDKIIVGKRMRVLNEGVVDELYGSIRRIGLQTPVTVRIGVLRGAGNSSSLTYTLVAGHHRLEAVKRLGWKQIPIIAYPDGDDHADLWEIDENLCRAELTELERGEHLAKRKQIYERLFPSSRRGAAHEPNGQFGHPATPNFAQSTAAKIGTSERNLRRSINRSEKIPEPLHDIIRNMPEIADSGVELDALAALPEADQYEAVQMVKDGKTQTIRKAAPLIKKDVVVTLPAAHVDASPPEPESVAMLPVVSPLETVKAAIKNLSTVDLAVFGEWFDEYRGKCIPADAQPDNCIGMCCEQAATAVVVEGDVVTEVGA